VIPQLAAALERPDAEPLSPYDERMLDQVREVLGVRRILYEEIPAATRSSA
jgi:hypothetical protein